MAREIATLCTALLPGVRTTECIIYLFSSLESLPAHTQFLSVRHAQRHANLDHVRTRVVRVLALFEIPLFGSTTDGELCQIVCGVANRFALCRMCSLSD